jgi:hypothetical protein
VFSTPIPTLSVRPRYAEYRLGFALTQKRRRGACRSVEPVDIQFRTFALLVTLRLLLDSADDTRQTTA